jgi:ABC-type lipoprotein export system ATPase subunit
MKLGLKQLLPTYFPESRKNNSEVWGRDLVFEAGDFVKIVAPSGSGKTSLVHFIYGMRNDYTGTVSYNEKDLAAEDREGLSVLRKTDVSIVFQDLRLFGEQTVFENIEIKRMLNPYHPAEKIKEMCERLGIGDKLSSLCKICSYGEQQRVSIIRALMQPYKLLLLDEPFSHLDESNSRKAMELMVEESKVRGAAIIFADLERVDYFPNTKLYHL